MRWLNVGWDATMVLSQLLTVSMNKAIEYDCVMCLQQLSNNHTNNVNKKALAAHQPL